MIFSSYKSVLLECVEAMRAGATVEQCLERYPRHADRLVPDLLLVERVSGTPRAQARPGAQDQAWAAAQERITDLRTGKKHAVPTVAVPSIGFGSLLKPVAIAAVAVGFFAATGGGLAYAAQNSEPDDPLYAVKLTGEDVRLWFVFDDSRKAELLLEQSNSRLNDILSSVSDGKSVPQNALADLHDRNERAANIMQDSPDDISLRTEVLAQAQRQEDLLVALWPQVDSSTTAEYSRTVAHLHNTRLDDGSGSAVAVVRPEELAGGIVDISGQATEIGDGLWDIGGVEVRIDERTIGRDQLEPGTSARFIVARSSGGRLYALSLYGPRSGPPPSGAFVSGEVEEVTSDGIMVAGNFIPFSSSTLQTGRFRVGDRVHVTLKETEDGVVADSVSTQGDGGDGEAQTFTFEGTIEGDIKSSNIWSIGGLDFTITPATSFDARAGSTASGARVQVEATNDGGSLEATRIAVLGSADDPGTVSIIGAFGGYDQAEGVWAVAGITVIPPETGEDPARGAQVFVLAKRDGADLVVTGYETIGDESDGLVRLQGTIHGITGANWKMEFGQVRVDSTVDVTGDPATGKRAIIWAQRGRDDQMQAVYAIVMDDVPVFTPTPAPTPSPAPTATQ